MQNDRPSHSAFIILHSSLDWWPARVTLPVQRIKSPLHHFNACRPKWYSRQDSHLHWRRSRRRVSAVGLRERNGWSPLPARLAIASERRRVLPRRDFLTMEAGGCRKEASEWLAEPKPANRGIRTPACALHASARQPSPSLLRRGRRLVAIPSAALDTAGL